MNVQRIQSEYKTKIRSDKSLIRKHFSEHFNKSARALDYKMSGKVPFSDLEKEFLFQELKLS